MAVKYIKLVLIILIIAIYMQNVLAVEESLDIGDYELQYEYQLDDVESGERFNLKLTLINNDDKNKTNIEFKFDEDFPFDFVDDDDFDLDLLAPNDSYSKTFRIEVDEDAKNQEYALEFSLEDDDDDYDDEIDIEVESSEPELIIADINSIPDIISADLDDVELRINVENIGGGAANFVRVRLILPEGFTNSNSFSDISNMGTIGEGEGKEVSFFIDTDKNIASGDHEATLEFEYEDNKDNPRRANLNFNIPVKGKPQFNIVSFKTIPDKVVQGGQARLEIVIENVGEEEGEETSVRVFENADLPVTFDEKTNFIGNLKKGERGTSSFLFDVDKTADIQEYLVKVQIRTVNKGNVLVSEGTVPINIVQSEDNRFAFFSIILLLILIIVLIVLIYRLSSRKA